MKRYLDRLRIALIASAAAGTLALYPVWQHHTLHVRSALFSSEAAAQAWERQFETAGGASCIRSTIVAKVEHPLSIGRDWFVDFKCNTPVVYERIAAIYLIPFVAVLALIAAIARMAAPLYRNGGGQ